MPTWSGGERLKEHLAKMETNLAVKATLQVGFLENAKYPDGTSVAMVAAINEYGARVEVMPGERTIYRMTNATGTKLLRNGKFVKKSKSNFASLHYVGAHVITIPPRPFFRTMIAAKSKSWPAGIAKQLKLNKYDVVKTLSVVGEGISGQLRQSIVDLTSPPHAASTIAKKKASKPLIDTGYMLSRVDYEVKTGETT